MSGFGPAPLDSHARAGLDEGAVALFAALPEQPGDGTFKAFARADNVASDGEIDPFSILDIIPAEIPAAAPSSDTVRSKSFRRRRTSEPISDSSVGDTSFGASEPDRSSGSDRGAFAFGRSFVRLTAAFATMKPR
jgi:hypothetical protein